jgi:glycerophosphoryl diester phosphodiesterase
VIGFLDGKPPRAFAHRGWHIGDLAGLENSMAAFRRAFDEGYRYLETDVRLTADGELIVFHDARLDRVTDRPGLVAALPWREVRQVRIGGTEPIPLLSDLLEEFPTARFNIDAKSDAAAGPLVDLVRKSGSAARVCLGSFSDRRLAAIRRACGPEVATSMGSREIFRLVRASALQRPFVLSARAAQVPVGLRGVPIVTPRFIAGAHAAGLEVHVWTIDDPIEMHRLLTLGVDGIMTDRPDVLRDVLRERGAWH